MPQSVDFVAGAGSGDLGSADCLLEAIAILHHGLLALRTKLDGHKLTKYPDDPQESNISHDDRDSKQTTPPKCYVGGERRSPPTRNSRRYDYGL